MADDIDVPPLEDLSAVLQKLHVNRERKTNDSCSRKPIEASSGIASANSCSTDGKIQISVSGIFASCQVAGYTCLSIHFVRNLHVYRMQQL